jgi:SAM-dependent methyltransferase
MTTPTQIHQQVQKNYTEVARAGVPCCSPSNTLYPLETLQDLPADIANFTAGNGDPVTPAHLLPGETVLDLGSGGGLDCFLASRQVGESGHVIGVDMTPEMIERARQAALRLDLQNVEFRLGYLEALPVEDNSVDVVISNCVINLSPNKPRVFREIHRVLKPRGKMVVSDIVLNRELPRAARNDENLLTACLAGALLRRDYLRAIRDAGFRKLEILSDHTYRASQAQGDPITSASAGALAGAAASITVLARK